MPSSGSNNSQLNDSHDYLTLFTPALTPLQPSKTSAPYLIRSSRLANLVLSELVLKECSAPICLKTDSPDISATKWCNCRFTRRAKSSSQAHIGTPSR